MNCVRYNHSTTIKAPANVPATQMSSNNKYALYDKGNDLLGQGNYTQAIQYFDKVLAIEPNDTYTLEANGAALDKLGTATPGNATKFLEYENSTYGIRMQYPSDWRVEGASNSSIVASFYP